MKMTYRKAARSIAIVGAACAMLALPQAGSAQLFLTDPDFKRAPIEPNDPLVGISIPGATADEYRAHLLWNLRAGLNVAALQCQFSPYLRAVPNYNALLAHHSTELAGAYKVIFDYFKRVHGQREGTRLFDDYATSTYNNFSTLHAQYGFCQTASAITKEALSQPKGGLYTLAQGRLRELRNSLVPVHDQIGVYNPHTIRLPVVRVVLDCSALRGRAKRQCEASGGV